MLVSYLYSGGLFIFWCAIFICWDVFILMIFHYSHELSTEIFDYFFHLLQILCSHFA